jgi:hypothetical protein
MKEVEVTTVEDYLSVIKEHQQESRSGSIVQDIVFRGQAGDFPLIPKLCRLHPKGDLLHVEADMLNEFKRSNPLLIQPQGAMDDWDYLALGQHFGLPTRLLDWSNNALTALWFAVSSNMNVCDSDSPYAMVWMLAAGEDDVVRNMNEIHPFNVPATKIFRPRLIKQRINNQSGVFTILSSEDIKQRRFMHQNDSFSEKLVRIKIPSDKIPDLRNDLNMLGVNAFSIFPELEGLCAYLQWRFFE